MDRTLSTPESGCCRMARRSSLEITKTVGRPQDRNPLKHRFINGGVVHPELSRRKCVYFTWRAAGSRILLANSSSSDATQKDSGISTPGFNLITRGSASQVFVLVLGSSIVRLN